MQQLNLLTISSLLIGLTVLLATVAGGWYLIERALAPIHRISAAAASISESRLTERIDVTSMELELSVLAHTINDAFDRLQLAIERQTRFTADASHELRTPLSIMLVQADRALKSPRSCEEYQEVVAAIRRAAKRMQGIVEGLLTLASRDASNVKLAMGSVAIHEIMEEACQIHEAAAELKAIELQSSLTPTMVYGDRMLLSEAVGNLIENAIKFSPQQGQVSIQLEHHGHEMVLSITDNGPGIAPRDQPFVFDRFFRADPARTSAGERRVGLGMAITKSIIETHGGQVTLFSVVGCGATFSVRLTQFAAADYTEAERHASRELNSPG